MKKFLLFLMFALFCIPWVTNAQVQVGDGTATNSYLPSYSLYNYSVTQQIYTAEEIAASGNITSIAFYNAGTEKARKYKIYMAHTTKSAFESGTDWIALTEADLVYEGAEAVAMVAGAWTTFILDTPFAYNGTDNLVVGVLDLTGSWESGMNCRAFTATNQALYKYQDAGAYGIDGTYNGTVQTANMASSKSQIILGGIQQAYPAPTGLTATPHPTSADLSWNENGTATQWEVAYKLSTDEEFTTVVVNTNPYTLTGLNGETSYNAKVRAYYSSTVQSAWSAVANFTTQVACPAPTALTSSNLTTSSATLTWTAGYEESDWVLQYGTTYGFTDGTYTEVTVNGTPTYELTGLSEFTTYYARVKADCGDTVSTWSTTTFTTKESCPDGKICIGEGVSTSTYVPANNYFNYSLTQQIYTADEIGEAGAILSIDFFKASTNAMEKNLDIYMVSTTKDEFTGTDDFVPVTASDLVFSGTVTFADNAWTTIELDAPFVYDGTSNVAIMVDNNTGDFVSSTPFYVFTSDKNQALYAQSDQTNFDPFAPAFSSRMTQKNRIRLNIGEPPACPKPTGVTVNYEGGTEATIIWTSDAENFTLQYYNDFEESEEIEVIGNSYTLTDLELATTYGVMVKANCNGAESEWTSPVSFTTDACLPENQCELTYELSDSYGDGWNGNYINVVDVETEAILATWTMSSGGSASGTLAVCDGRAIQFQYVVSGSYSYPGENSWVIKDINEEVIWEYESPSASMSQDHTVSCVVTTCRKPTNLAASNEGPTSVDLSWDENGESDRWQIRYKVATDSVYSASPVNATTNPFTLTGLHAETTYTAQVKPRCDVEKWSDEITFTTNVACPAPSNIEVEATATDAAISWTGFSDSYNLKYRTPRGFNYGFEQAEAWAVDNFAPCTTYDGDSTQCYGLEGQTFTNFPFTGACIAFQNQEGNLASHSGNAFGLMVSAIPDYYPDGITHSDDWFILPELTIAAGDVFSFWGREITTQYGDETINVGVYGSTEGTFSSLLAENVAVNSTTYTKYEYDLSEYAGQTIRLAINYVSDDIFGFMFDDIFVGDPNDDTWDYEFTGVSSPYTISDLTPETDYEVAIQGVCGEDSSAWGNATFVTPPTCQVPANLVVENVTTTTAQVSWVSDAASFDIEVNEVVTENVSNPYTLENLEPGTIYTVRVRANCGDNDYSVWTSTYSFTTPCEAFDLPYAYGFETNDDILCWSRLSANSTNSMGIIDMEEQEGLELDAYEGTKVFLFSSYNSAEAYDQVIITPELNGSGAENDVRVQFAYMGYGSGTETFMVGYSTTTNDLEEFTWSDSTYEAVNNEWTLFDETYPAGTKYVAVYYTSDYQYYMMVDDFNIEEVVTTDEQTIALSAGWNWVSFNVDVTVDDLKAALLEAVPSTAIQIKGKGSSTSYDPARNRWLGTLAWDVANMYKIKVAADCEIELEGMPLDPAEASFTVVNGANWIGFPLNQSMTLTDAFAGFAANGDQIKGKNGSATYNRGRWNGSTLTSLEPGKGYVYISASSESRPLVFPNSAR